MRNEVSRRLSAGDASGSSAIAVLLGVSMVLWVCIGWFVFAGLLPLYSIPLIFALGLYLVTGSFAGLGRGGRIVVGTLLILTVWTAGIELLYRDAPLGLSRVLNFGAATALVVVASHVGRVYVRLRRMFVLYAVLALVSLLLAVLQWKTGRFYPSDIYYEGGVTGLESMNFAFGKTFLPLLAVGMAVSVWFLRSRQRIPVWAVGLVTVGIAGVLLSHSRSTQIGVALMAVVAVIVSRSVKMLFAGAFFVAIAAAVALRSEKWSIDLSLGLNEVSGGRVVFWEAGLEMVKDSPVLGVGPGAFKQLLASYSTTDGIEHLRNAGLLEKGIESHNVFIGVASEQGLPAFILFSAYYLALAAVLVRMYRCPIGDMRKRVAALAGLLYLCGYVVDSCFHNYLDDNTIWMFSGLLLGLESNKRLNVVARDSIAAADGPVASASWR